MSARYGPRLLHLATAVDLPDCFAAEPYVELVRLAERGGLDFVTLDDSFTRAGPDALGTLSRVAPATRRIGLVPTVAATHAEPFVAPGAVTTLDWVSRGRAGWRTDVSAGADAAAKPGDGREDGAGIRDVPVGRSAGRDMPHHVDLTGGAFPARGPSAVPRPPQGHPVHVLDATDGQARTLAARYADVALVRAATPAQAAAVREELIEHAGEFGRDPDSVRVLVSLLVDLGDGERAAEPGHGGGGPRPTVRGPLYRGGPVDLAELVAGWHADGVADGFHLVPVEPRRDLERLVNGTVVLLQHRGLFRTFYPGSTLREHLGLARPATPYAVAGRNVMTGGTS